jgi:cell division septation protein DedD
MHTPFGKGRGGMALGRQWSKRGAVLAALAIAAPALAQPADPDSPVPTARYERPPEGVDPAILNQPAPEPAMARPSEPTAVAAPTIAIPEAPVVRRRGSRAPASLETPTAMPQERPWERPSVGAERAPPVEAPPQETRMVAPAPRPAPQGRKVELQIGAFADRANAERAARTARAAGPTRIASVIVDGVTYHRVIVGPASEPAMRAALERLGFRDARPVRR